jgi:hypothetical protein
MSLEHPKKSSLGWRVWSPLETWHSRLNKGAMFGGISDNYRRKEIPMKRTVFSVMSIGLLASTTLLTAQPKSEAQELRSCSLETLHGQYLFSANGMLFPPAFGVSKPSASAAAGYSIYNGDGTGTDYVTFTIEGVDVHTASPAPMTYTLNPDCTGTRKVLPDGPNFNIFVATNGSGLTEVSTDPGFAVSFSDNRVGRAR